MSHPILHITDLHMGEDLHQGQDNATARALGVFDAILSRWSASSEGEKPIVVITGDVGNGVKHIEGNYRIAEDRIVKLRAIGIEVVVIPGNHDFVLKGTFGGIWHFNLFNQILLAPAQTQYPFLYEFDGWRIFAVNSMAFPDLDNPGNLAKGLIGPTQRNALDAKLAQLQKSNGDKVAVCLHHHPFLLPDSIMMPAIKAACAKFEWLIVVIDKIFKNHSIDWKLFKAIIASHKKAANVDVDEAKLFDIYERATHCLEDGKELLDVLKRHNVDLLLFGHDHMPYDFSQSVDGKPPLTQQYGIKAILSGGSTMDKCSWLVDHDSLHATDPKLLG